MNMMRYKKICNTLRGLVMAAAATAALAGCTVDDGLEPDNGNGNTGDGTEHAESGEVTFNFAVPTAEVVAAQTRAVQSENLIGSLWVLMCDADGKYEKRSKATSVALPPTGDVEGAVMLNATVQIDFRSTPYTMMFVANLPNESLLDDLTTDMTRTDIQTLLTLGYPDDTDDWNVPIPMYGEVSGTEIVKNGNPTPFADRVTLHRMLARVKVRSSADRFQLDGVMVGNYNDEGVLVPTGYDTQGKPLFTIPVEPTTTGLNALHVSSNGECNIYVFEQDKNVVYPLTGWKKSPCLLVQGTYDANDNNVFEDSERGWYRIDFVRYVGDSKVPDPIKEIKRNHSYEFTITAIAGKGYASADDAIARPGANIDAQVVVWDENDLTGKNLDDIYTGTRHIITVTPDVPGGEGRAEYEYALEGMPVEIAAVPKLGYRFAEWTVTRKSDGTRVGFVNGYNAASNPAVFTMPADSVSVTPSFEEARYFDVTLGDVLDEWGNTVCTVSASSISKPIDGYRLKPGTTVTITATVAPTHNSPDFRYAYFKGWKLTKTASGEDVTASLLSGGVSASATANPAAFAMPDYQVTATPMLGYRVKIVSNGEGVIGETPADNDSRDANSAVGVLPGTTVTYTAMMRDGYYFVRWTEYPGIDNSDTPVREITDTTITFNMPVGGRLLTSTGTPYRTLDIEALDTSGENVSGVEFTYTEPHYTKTYSNGTQTIGYRNWTDITVDATTPAGYKLTGWKINGANYHGGATSPMTFRIQDATNTVTAQYTRWHKITPTAVLLNDDETVAEDITAQLLQAGKTFTYNSNTSSNVEVEADNTAWAKHKENVDVVAPDLTAAPHGYGFVRWHDGTSPKGRGISYYLIRQNQTPTAYYKRLYTATANVSLGGSVQANTGITYHTVNGTTPGAAMTGNSKPEWISGVAAHYAVKAPATVTNTTDGRIYAFEGWTATGTNGTVTRVDHTNAEGDRLFIFDTSAATGNVTLTAGYVLPHTASVGVTTHAGQTTPVPFTAADGFTIHRGNTASGTALDWATLGQGSYTATAPATLTIAGKTHYFYGWAANADNAAAHTFDITNGNVALEARYTHIPPSSSVKVWTYTYRSGGRDIVVEGTTEWSSRNLSSAGVFDTETAADVEAFGDYFNWQTAQTACPWGWRLPTAQEVAGLVGASWNGTDFRALGNAGTYSAGGSTNNLTTNPGGLTIPVAGYADLFFPHAGYKSATGNTIEYHGQGRYWTSDQFNSSRGYLLFLGPATDYDNGALQSEGGKTYRQSVRCVRDAN